jgi:hypothetical protein
MMAFDRTPSAPNLDPATIEGLRAVLARSVLRGTHSDDLHALLVGAAVEARDKGLQAEQLLLVLKQLWYSLPEVTGAASADVENRLLQELISRCIRAYYAQ